MNDFVSAIILAIVQGITEWIPVSSSGHLVLVERLLNYNGGLFFDVALHFGTLMAVFVYFGRDITNILEDLLKGRWKSENGRLGIYILIATIPAGIVGTIFLNYFEQIFGNLLFVALGFGITGLLLFIASIDVKRKRELNIKGAFLIGLAQIASIFPGISRSGTTISSGLLLGLNEKDAVKFSFLMSIPIIFGANILTIGNRVLPKELIWATLVSFFVGLGAIHVLYKYVLLDKKRLRWFGGYALLLGLIVLVWSLVF